jgi:hypothetical protein
LVSTMHKVVCLLVSTLLLTTLPGSATCSGISQQASDTRGNSDMGLLDYVQRLVGIPEDMSNDPAARGVMGIPQPQRKPGGLISKFPAQAAPISIIEDMSSDPAAQAVPRPKDFYEDVIYPILKVAEGGYKKDSKDRLDWNSAQLGKGNLVGTNKGVTAYALSKHLNIPSSSITEKTMRGVSEETAKNVFRNQYYIKYGIDKAPKNVQPILASAAVLRPTAAIAAKRSKTPQQAANLVIQNFGKIPLKGPYYKKNIRGWVNRFRRDANMKTFKTKEQIYKVYPILRP